MRNIDKDKIRFNFAVDCDVLLNLSLIAEGKTPRINNAVMSKAIFKLWKMVYEGDVKLYITPQILCELGRFNPQYDERMASREFAFVLPDIAKFVRTYCYPIYIKPNKELEFKRRAKELALRYVDEAGFECSVLKRKNGKEITVPSKDAKALAEASLCGLSFLTCNSKDFIATVQESGAFISDKLNNVIKINKKFGLGYKKEDCAWTDCPVPMSVTNFIKNLPDCYMDTPFLKDTNYYVQDLLPSEVDAISKAYYVKLNKFLKSMESGEIEATEYGIKHPYWFRKNVKDNQGNDIEEIVKF